jgi:hypothetical protein
VLVEGVDFGSAAAEAGAVDGCTILELDSKGTRSLKDCQEIKPAHKKGGPYVFLFKRPDGSQFITLPEWPPWRGGGRIIPAREDLGSEDPVSCRAKTSGSRAGRCFPAKGKKKAGNPCLPGFKKPLSAQLKPIQFKTIMLKL